jgi:TetR/AcrR family transcriptional repressor of nem operon
MSYGADMSPVEAAEKSRGRPRSFDECEVLDKLVELFWEHGYEASSLIEIVEAAGLNKSSLYNTFGSKDELFYIVLDRYITDKERMLDEALAEGGIDSLLAFFELQREMVLTTVGARGCMAVNAATELGMRDDRMVEVADRYRRTMREGMRRPLAWSAEHGEIDPAMLDMYVEILVSSMLGMSVSARSGATRDEMGTLLDSIVMLINSWKR